MTEFVEIPPNKRSKLTRRLTHGVGINDATYQVQPIINGKHLRCPFYERWYEMLKRCYSKKYQSKKPTYVGCSASEDWLTFSNFKIWMVKQQWKGMELDKDIIKPGNKVYSPVNCCFVPRSLNALISVPKSNKGKYPTGVCFDKFYGKFDSSLGVNGKRVRIGRYETPEAASKAYIKAKTKIIIEAASMQTDPRIANGLRQHAKLLLTLE